MIEVKDLTKRYAKNTALDNINFVVHENEIVGFLGPNGAGKTTTMNIITGYTVQSSGEVIIDKINISDDPLKAKKNIGYLPDNPPLYPDMRVCEYLNFVCELKSADKKDIDQIMDQLKISEVKNKLIKNLSKGYRQRVGLAQALIGNPKVLILDEPTSGLDPKQIIEMRDLIISLKNERMILLSSHILSEISTIADRVVIINKGKIVADNTPDELSKNLMHGKKVIARIRGEKQNICDLLKKYLDELSDGCANISDVKENIEPDTVDLTIESNSNDFDLREKIFEFTCQNNFVLLMLKPFDISLEEAFLQVTGENKNQTENEEKDIESDDNNSAEAKTDINNQETREDEQKNNKTDKKTEVE